MSYTAIFYFTDTPATEICTLSLHDALPICSGDQGSAATAGHRPQQRHLDPHLDPPVGSGGHPHHGPPRRPDRKSTRLNSSHANISYAVFCLKKNTPVRRLRRHLTIGHTHVR